MITIEKILGESILSRLQCCNPKCPHKKEESSFVLHTYHIEEHDYQIDEDGNIGKDAVKSTVDYV